MATTTRQITAEAFLRRVKGLYGTVRREIVEALAQVGNDPEKLPEELWREIEEKEKRVLLYLLMGMSIGVFDYAFNYLDDEYPGDIDYEDARNNLESELNRRATWTAGKITETTRDRLFRSFERMPGDVPVEDIVEGVLSPSRVDLLVRTEMRAAQNIPKNVLTTLSTSNDVYLVWHVGPTERHCPLCPLLHGTDRDFWGRYVPDGPPTPHFGCLCSTDIVIGDYDWLRETGQLLPHPRQGQVRDAMKLIGLPMPSSGNIQATQMRKSLSLKNCGTGAGGFQPGNTCATKSEYAGPKRGQLGHEFTTPISGPTGAQLTGYDWRHELIELEDDRIKRVSVWEEAEESPVTGRRIVHLWDVTKSNGEKAIMSFESALVELGYVDDQSSQNIRTIAAAVLKKIELESVFNRTGDESIRPKIAAINERIEALNRIANDKDNTPEGRRNWMNRAEIAKHVLRNHSGELSESEMIKNGQVSLEWKRKLSAIDRSVERAMGKYSNADTDRKLTNWYRDNHENVQSAVNNAEALLRASFPYADEILLMSNSDDVSNAIRKLGRVRNSVSDALLRYYSTGRQMTHGYLAQSPKGEIVRVDGSDEQDVRFFLERNFERISDIVADTGEMIAMGSRPAKPAASVVLPVSAQLRKSAFDAIFTKNCGTGAGGFKPGNTCAGESGSLPMGEEKKEQFVRSILKASRDRRDFNAEEQTDLTVWEMDKAMQEAVMDAMTDIANRHKCTIYGETAGTGSHYIFIERDETDDADEVRVKVRVSNHKQKYSADWSFEPDSPEKHIRWGIEEIEKLCR